MRNDNKEIVFQLSSALVLIFGIITNNQFLIIGGLIPIILAILLVYR